MISQLSVLAHTIGPRAYHLLCAPDAPLPELKEALVQFLRMVSDLEDTLKEEQQKEKEDKEAKQEDQQEQDSKHV